MIIPVTNQVKTQRMMMVESILRSLEPQWRTRKDKKIKKGGKRVTERRDEDELYHGDFPMCPLGC